MTENLLPCPFCGGDALMTQVASVFGDHVIWVVGCNNEDCEVTFNGHARQADAARTWNTRTAASPWIPIRSVEDLPKITGDYLWLRRNRAETGELAMTHWFDTKKPWMSRDAIVRNYEVYMPIPPYSPDEGERNESR